MPLEHATAIVLRLVPWSEASYVCTLFTREFGRVRAVAKGAKRRKGPFESALDLLALCKVVFLRKSSDALDILTEAKLSRRFRLRGRELAGLYAGYYVAELLAELTDDYDPHPELFDLADHTLAALQEEAQVGRLVLRFELAALRLLGHAPSLTRCAECGTAVGGEGRVAFSQIAGGALCPRCRPGKRQVVSLSQPAWQALVMLAQGDEPAWRQAPLARGTLTEARSVMNHYVAGLLGHEPRLQPYMTAGASKMTNDE
jgi:DNA repair protein RecO (recombination protein O)